MNVDRIVAQDRANERLRQSHAALLAACEELRQSLNLAVVWVDSEEIARGCYAACDTAIKTIAQAKAL